MLSTWDQAVATLTEPYREGKARDHEHKGRVRRNEVAEHEWGVVTAQQLMRREEGQDRDRRALTELVDYETVKLGDLVVPGFMNIPTPHRDALREAGQWHFSRARGQRERFDRVDNCQKEAAVDIHCEACGEVVTRAARCRVALVCVSCRGKIGLEKRARLAKNRRAAIRLCRDAGLFRRRRQGGAWSEKLLTLTIPQIPHLGVKERIEFARAAWAEFAWRWRRWLKHHPDGRYRSAAWLKAHPSSTPRDGFGHMLARWVKHAEWTPGKDGLGHPHFHMWFLGPFLPGAKAGQDPANNTLRALWREALLAAAALRDDMVQISFHAAHAEAEVRAWFEPKPPMPGALRRSQARLLRRLAQSFDELVVDVRQCRPGPGSLQEVIKYLFKDLVGRGEAGAARDGSGRLEPEVWAKVFASFDGTRTTQGSRGLMSLAKRLESHAFGEGALCACGARGHWVVHRRMLTEEEKRMVEHLRAARRAERIAKCIPPPPQQIFKPFFRRDERVA
jgi:hypothetical protein